MVTDNKIFMNMTRSVSCHGYLLFAPDHAVKPRECVDDGGTNNLWCNVLNLQNENAENISSSQCHPYYCVLFLQNPITPLPLRL